MFNIGDTVRITDVDVITATLNTVSDITGNPPEVGDTGVVTSLEDTWPVVDFPTCTKKSKAEYGDGKGGWYYAPSCLELVTDKEETE